MTLLRDHLKRSQSTEEGVRDYVADVCARHPPMEKTAWGLSQQVACHWRVGYVTRSDAVVSLLMMPFWLLGHVSARSSYIDFTTYHYLTVPEVRSLRQRRMLKYFLLPFVIFALVMTGIALLIGLMVAVVMIFHLGPPEDDGGHPVMAAGMAAAGLVVLCLIFLASLKAQRRLYKMGQPPHADDFRDQQVLLKSVDIK